MKQAISLCPTSTGIDLELCLDLRARIAYAFAPSDRNSL